jgi:hypothetical protein
VASPSATPTNLPARFVPSNVLVARIQNASSLFVAGRYTPLFLDELDPVSGVVVSTLALPTEQVLNADGSVAQYRCTAVMGMEMGEIFPQTTTNGLAVTLPCYDGVVCGPARARSTASL